MKNKIQIRIMLLVSCIVVIFLSALIFIRFTEEKKLLTLMKAEEKDQAILVNKSIRLLSKNLETMTKDYTQWDEMVNFVKNPTDAWSEVNLDPGFTTFNIRMVLVYTTDFSCVYLTSLDNDTLINFPVDQVEFRNIVEKKLFTHFFFYTSNGLMEFFGAPIQASVDYQRISKPSGYFFTGRLWSEDYLKEIGTITSTNVTLSRNLSDSVVNENHYENFSTANTQILLGWDGKPVSILKSLKNMPIYKNTYDISKLQFYAITIFEALFALGLSLYLFIEVNNPLRAISKSLQSENVVYLKKLKQKKDEFGHLASLIIQFFNQKQKLEEEIQARKKVEKELLLIQGHLEVLVEKHTASNLSLEIDIAERKKMEQELVKAKENAEQSDNLKSEFLAQMSHEIRSPINTLLNYISLIKEEIQQPYNDDIKFSFNAINSSSKRLIRTIDLILNMSQIQTGNIECKYSKLNIKTDVLDSIVNEFRSLASIRGLELSLECTTENLIIYADHYSLSQIFTNLVDNAIKYTKRGKVHITVYKNPLNYISVDITDTGIGIAEGFQKKLFNPFTQEEQGYTRKYDGNGLGLALVKKYCELNNASISVRSVKNFGSTFTVEFFNKELL